MTLAISGVASWGLGKPWSEMRPYVEAVVGKQAEITAPDADNSPAQTGNQHLQSAITAESKSEDNRHGVGFVGGKAAMQLGTVSGNQHVDTAPGAVSRKDAPSSVRRRRARRGRRVKEPRAPYPLTPTSACAQSSLPCRFATRWLFYRRSESVTGFTEVDKGHDGPLLQALQLGTVAPAQSPPGKSEVKGTERPLLQALQLGTVAPAQSPPGKIRETVSDISEADKRRSVALRAILRAPVEVQDLYRAELISQKVAAKLGPKDASKAPSRR